MIRIKMSTEVFADIFTPGVLVPHKCTKGLPRGAKLTEITLDPSTETVICLFDDGKIDLEERTITFTSTQR